MVNASCDKEMFATDKIPELTDPQQTYKTSVKMLHTLKTARYYDSAKRLKKPGFTKRIEIGKHANGNPVSIRKLV